MSLRLRYYLAILPLFVGLGLINSLLGYYVERNEIRWGLQERSQGVAASIAGFWEVIPGQSDGDPSNALERYSNRLGGLSISWFEPSGASWRERPLRHETAIPAPPAPTPELTSKLNAGRLAWAFVELTGAPSDLSVGYAPVTDADGNVLAVIAVSERDSSLRDAIAALQRRLAILMVALILVGVGAAELITRIARRELGALTSAAREATQGRYVQELREGRIRELNDLGGTLLTMTSLLADESHQTRRRFFKSAPLPDDSELALSYRTHLEPPMPGSLGPARLSYRRLGVIEPEDFCGWRKAPTGWYLVLGRCRRTDAALSALERMVRSEATRDFLLGVAVGRPHGPTWPQALKLFPCAALQLVFIPASGNAPTGWTLDPARDVPVPWTPTERRDVLGSLPAEALNIGQAYSDQFPDRSAEQIADELAGLLCTRFQGQLVICDREDNKATV
jgi:hypothetical protein